MIAISLIHVFCAIAIANFILTAALAVYTLIISRRRIRRNEKNILSLADTMNQALELLLKVIPSEEDILTQQIMHWTNPNTNPLT